MRTKLSMGALALTALMVAGCTADTPTAPGDESPAFSKGQATQDLGRLGARGWTCVPIPTLGVHCFGPGAFVATPSVPVLVYDSQDAEDDAAPFLGTEILIRDDLYAGQPCIAEGGGAYMLLPAAETGFAADYRACHHYSHDD